MSTRITLAILTLAAIIAAGLSGLDAWALEHLSAPDTAGEDWARLLRVMGFVPTWIVVGAIFVLVDFARRERLRPPLRDPWTRGVLVFLSALCAGFLAELLKILLRRARPYLTEEGEWTGYVFRAWEESPWSSSGLGLPSSHTAVAFGALCMLGYFHKPARPAFLLLAFGCGMTRVLSGAHYATDTLVGACAGGMAAVILWAMHAGHLRKDAEQ